MELDPCKVILLVEDNPNDVELTLMAFESNRLNNPISVARDGQEALDYLYGSEGKTNNLPALVILDLNLPLVNGLEVLEEIRANPKTKYLPVIILTSSSEQQDILDAYELGTNAYVPKPVDFIHFTSAIKQLGLFWLVLNKCPYNAK